MSLTIHYSTDKQHYPLLLALTGETKAKQKQQQVEELGVAEEADKEKEKEEEEEEEQLNKEESEFHIARSYFQPSVQQLNT
ncbi:hypothetical protein ACLKA7_017448 [Drosophila subpalustris]